MKRHYHIIGAGGVGSWLTPSLCLLVGQHNVTLYDGDTLEDKNLNRQLFDKRDIQRNKAQALAARYGCQSFPYFYSLSQHQHNEDDLLICCADNHPARRETLEACDEMGCDAIIACNETHSSEAFYYQREWKGTPLDPRVYYPEIGTITTGDPRAQRIGCTGQAQAENPQLVSANMMAASLALHLVVIWALEAPKLEPETLLALPFRLNVNLSSLSMTLVRDAQQKDKQ